ncbi:MAG: hypothetical protein ABIP48_09875 [Planctomycetota bacterium]
MVKDAKVDRLFNLMEQALTPPENLLAAVEGLPPVATLPSAWTTWLFVVLIRYRRRQRWAMRMLRKHFPEAVPPSERLYKQWDRDPPLTVTVPGASKWELQLECELEFGFLIHKLTGEMISVRLSGSKTDHIIFPDSMDHYLVSPAPQTPEGRLLGLHPEFLTMAQPAISDLECAGLLEGIEYDGDPSEENMEPEAHRLTPKALWYEKLVVAFAKNWENLDYRLWLACLVGDWMLAHELASATADGHLIEHTRQRAEECRQIRIRRLRGERGQAVGHADEQDGCPEDEYDDEEEEYYYDEDDYPEDDTDDEQP